MPKKQREVKELDDLEHFKVRAAMYIGSVENQELETYILNEDKTAFVRRTINYTPALNKIIDEVVVNAIDHWVNFPGEVTSIEINFEPNSGQISVYNSGPGMQVKETTTLSGKPIWVPQLIAAVFKVGDNFESADRVTGGANGIGLKATNAFSRELTLETCDMETKKLYTQVFRDGLSKIEAPTIANAAARAKPHTRITFLPMYDQLGYEGGYNAERDSKDIAAMIEFRAYQAATYTGITVVLNVSELKKIRIKPIDYAAMFGEIGGPKPVRLLFVNELNAEHSIEAFVLPSDGHLRHMSIVNGVCAHEGGTHIDFVQKAIVEELKPKLKTFAKKIDKTVTSNVISNNLFIVAKATIPNPVWGGGNIKSRLENAAKNFATWKLTEGKIASLWPVLEAQIKSQFLGKSADKPKRVSRSLDGIEKCCDALLAGTKTHSAKCTLVICEGDSAEGSIRDGISSNKKIVSWNVFGTFNIQGVPVNARKEITRVSDLLKKRRTTKTAAKDASTVVAAVVSTAGPANAAVASDAPTNKYRRSKKLTENERVNSLMKVLGLDFARTYETEAEVKTLRYGRVIVATDQDEDGKGNIFGLIVNFFVLFWPRLVARGFINRLNTPIIRAYPKSAKGLIEEFYTLHQYRQWAGLHLSSPQSHRIKYYKGLGTHSKEERSQNIKSMIKNLYHYELDEKAEETLEIYFGKETKERKIALISPVSEADEVQLATSNDVPITLQLNIDTKSYQRDNIIRKIPHVFDGLVPARRKVLYATRVIFGRSNKEIKLAKIASDVSGMTEYHHGEASLCNTIIKMAQDFPGARNLPMLRPRGLFGTRAKGGTDAASPRYIFADMNTRLCQAMYPRVDDWLLPYEFDEGVRVEPQYYLPLLPMCVLESMEVPATGWSVKVFARDFDEVVANVRALISGAAKHAKPMKIWQNHVDTDIREVMSGAKVQRKTLYSYGRYKYDKETGQLVVSQLPIGKFSYQITAPDEKKLRDEMIRAPLDETTDEEVHVTFFFDTTKIASILENFGDEFTTPFEHYLGLRNPINSIINVIDAEKKIVEVSGEKYEKLVDLWFVARRDLYGVRIDREIVLTRLRIVYYENVIRFTKTHASYRITNKTRMDELVALLTREKYDMIDHVLLFAPAYTKTEELTDAILVRNAAIGARAAEAPKKASKKAPAEDDESEEQGHVNEEERSHGPTFMYLANLKYTDMIERACVRRDAHLAQERELLKELLADCGAPFKGAKAWLRELDALEETIRLGLAKGWDYGKARPKFRA